MKMMSRLVSLLTAAALGGFSILGTCAAALDYGSEWGGRNDLSGILENGGTYRDVPVSHWAVEAVEICTQKHWFDGYPDGTFHPEGEILRAEAMKVYVMFLGWPLGEVTNPTYYDVAATAWYAPYVEAGRELFPEMTAPDGRKKFQPEMPITREVAIYALVKALGYDSEVKFVDESVLNMFSDQRSISTGIRPYIAWAVNNGLAAGYDDGTICAQEPLTRAEFATVLYRGSRFGYNDVEIKRVVSSTELYPDALAEMLIGDSLSVMAFTNYTDGTREECSDSLNPYVDGAEGILSVNKNKITAIGEGTATVRFNSESFKDKSLVVNVKDARSAPVISISEAPSSTAADTAVIRGSVEDETGTTIALSCNNSALVMNSDGSFTANVNLASGVNKFEIKAVNGAGKEGSRVVEITREEPTPEPTEEPTPEPTEEPEPAPTPEPVYTLDPLEVSAEIVRLPTEEERSVTVRVSYSGFSAAKLTSAEFILKADPDIYVFRSRASSTESGGTLANQRLSKGVKFTFDSSEGSTAPSGTFADIVFDVDSSYDLSSVGIGDFALDSFKLKNGGIDYDEQNTSIILR